MIPKIRNGSLRHDGIQSLPRSRDVLRQSQQLTTPAGSKAQSACSYPMSATAIARHPCIGIHVRMYRLPTWMPIHGCRAMAEVRNKSSALYTGERTREDAMTEPASSRQSTPHRLVIRNIGLLLSGHLERPILDADTVVAVDGRIAAVGKEKDIDTANPTLL